MPRAELIAAAALVVTGACMRTPLVSSHAGNGGNQATSTTTIVLGTGGWVGTGGSPMTTAGSGGRVGTGGVPMTTVGTGGRPGSGGSRATGGVSGSGGSRATGGVSSTGGIGSGGTIGTGGASKTTITGGTTSSGGRIGTGGSGTGGASHTGGTTATGGVRGSGGASGRGGTSGTAPYCGDGTVQVGEDCDLGADNHVSAAFTVSQGANSFPALPLIGSKSGAAFYDYRSSSAHTGFEAVGTSRVLLYFDRSTFSLSLVCFHGIDKDSTGEIQPADSQVKFEFTGLPETAIVTVADESDEVMVTSPTTATGFWHFDANTDGVVFSGLPFPGDWKVTVAPSFVQGISTWTWVDSDGSFVTLDPTQPITIEARANHGQCRTDCSVPQCGDGILDGGEICDDGQPSPSGCSMNCSSYN